MKKVAALILSMIVSGIVFGQENQLVYTATVPVANATAKELHDRCISWFSRIPDSQEKALVKSTDDKMIATLSPPADQDLQS